MDKDKLLALVIREIERDIEGTLRAAESTISAATDPDSRAENKYDTRSLEASYLARGQSLRVAALQADLEAFRSLKLPPPGADARAALGSLVFLETDDEPLWCFLGPGWGGNEVRLGRETVTVFSPDSPLAKVLLGKRAGDTIPAPHGPPWLVVSVD